jgi:CheY-like chemotaxis protein
MNALIVDDQPTIARVTATALGLLGWRTFATRTTAGAIELLGTEKIDALFLDLNLRGENGLELLSRLAGLERRPLVIMFTAENRDEFAAEAFRRGAFSCLIKPFSLEDLRGQMVQIEQYLRHREGSLISHEQLDYL